MTSRQILHVEAVQKPSSGMDRSFLRHQIQFFFETKADFVEDNTKFGPQDLVVNQFLFQHLDSISVETGDGLKSGPVSFKNAELKIYIFRLDSTGCQLEDLDGNERIHAASNFMLPSEEFEGLWESLIYEDDIKEKLLRYVNTAMVLSDHGIDSKLISWNKVVLLHGPPGTGKTSLCKALAQKMAIRLSDRYDCGQLVEINSHSLFSKWFSESGKLVQKMFEQIQEMIEDPRVFVCVLIDEVESLSAARSASANEPSDAIRVVNALLTQIDAIKRFPNVLIMTTSNVTGTIDLAFVDRADIKHYVGHPSKFAICGMLHGSIQELMRKGLMYPTDIGNLYLMMKTCSLRSEAGGDDGGSYDNALMELSARCQGLSGRTIRKAPFLALTQFLSYPVTLDNFYVALDVCIKEQRRDIENLTIAESR